MHLFFREGFERRKLARDDSYVVSYYNNEDANFRLNPFRYQIVITDPIDYSDKAVRQVRVNDNWNHKTCNRRINIYLRKSSLKTLLNIISLS